MDDVAGAAHPPAGPSTPALSRGRRSLRRRVYRLAISALGLQLVLVSIATGAAVLSAMDGLRAVSDRGTEAAAAAVLAGMADEQSGLLAFVNFPSEATSLLVYEQG